MANDRDPEEWVPAQLRAALRPVWRDLWVSRTRDGQVPAVTVLRGGGQFGRVTDGWRLLVNCYAATEDQANRLAYDVANELLKLADHGAVKKVDVTAPQAVQSSATEPAHRLITVDALTRRVRS